MFVIELHDDEVHNLQGGTLAAKIGRKSGTIQYPYQVEMHLQEEEAQVSEWRRAYVLHDATAVAAVFSRNGIWSRSANTNMQYVGRDPGYSGEWVLPHLYEPAGRIAVGRFGLDARSFEEAASWAQLQLVDEGIATAVMIHNAAVYAAWERMPNGLALVARGPQP